MWTSTCHKRHLTCRNDVDKGVSTCPHVHVHTAKGKTLIPNSNPNIRAVYVAPAKDENERPMAGRRDVITVPVVAWSSAGVALVPTADGRLVDALDLYPSTSEVEFLHLQRDTATRWAMDRD